MVFLRVAVLHRFYCSVDFVDSVPSGILGPWRKHNTIPLKLLLWDVRVVAFSTDSVKPSMPFSNDACSLYF